MMRTSMAAAAAAVLLTACSAGTDTAQRVVEVQERYAALADYTATVEVELPRAEETLRYTLALVGEGEKVSVEVLEPEVLRGVGAVLTGEKLQLRYDDLVLDAGTMAEELNAPRAVPLVLRALAEGYVVDYGTEPLGEETALRLGLELDVAGQTLPLSVWLGEEERPLLAEFSDNGQILARIEFTDFAFGAIMPLNDDAAMSPHT